MKKRVAKRRYHFRYTYLTEMEYGSDRAVTTNKAIFPIMDHLSKEVERIKGRQSAVITSIHLI